MSNREKATKALEIVGDWLTDDMVVASLMNDYFSGDEALKFAEFIMKEYECDSVDEVVGNNVG